MLDSQKIGTVRTHATLAVAAPMLSISFSLFEYCSNSLSDALIILYLSIYNTIEIYLHSIIII